MDKKAIKELLDAIDFVSKEKGLDKNIILEALEAAMGAAYKKKEGIANVKASLDGDNGKLRMFIYKNVMEEVTDENVEISLEDAKEYKDDAQIGDVVDIEVPLTLDFGRVAAGTAKQVVVQKLKEAEKNILEEEFRDKKDELIVGTLSREDKNNYYVDLGKTFGILPKEEIIPGETLEMGNSVKAYILKLELGTKGLFILLSRKHFGFVKRLLESEIPELSDGSVMLYSVARDAGLRSKIAVYSEYSNIDPMGAIIGEKRTRINNIINELGGEKIDIVLYDKDPVKFITNALSPARDVIVEIPDESKKEANVIVNDENSSLAIGKKGQNIRLASKLTKYKLNIVKEGD